MVMSAKVLFVTLFLIICAKSARIVTLPSLEQIGDNSTTIVSDLNEFSNNGTAENETLSGGENGNVTNTTNSGAPVYNDVSLPANFSETGNGSTVCYGVLGCFGRRDFADALKRPINLFPQTPDEINVTFSLYTGKNKFQPNVLKFDLTEDDLTATNFDPSKPIKFIIHGFGGSFDDMQWMGDIKDLVLNLATDEYNVFGVDWSQGTSTIIYMQAVANTRVVGAATAYFISKLVEYKQINVKDIHLIGHSLGSHVAGYTGERFTDPQIGRITSLDPAGPDFYKNDPASRLDLTDAAYVEAIHTDYGNVLLEGLGLEDNVGRDDFYPNSGYRQPGCGITKGVFNVLSKGIGKGIEKTVACNHQRSWALFLVNPKALDENCQFVGYECESYNKFKDGKCGDCGDDGSKCGIFSVLGKDDPKYGKLYSQQMTRRLNVTGDRRLFFKTGDAKPFCLHHYQIIIQISKEMKRSATGFIKLDLQGSRRSVSDVKLGEAVKSFSAGDEVTSLQTFVKSLGAVEQVTLKWTFGGIQLLDPTKLFKFPKINVEKISVNYMSNIDPAVRAKFSSVLCPSGSTEIKSGSTMTFTKCGNQTLTTSNSGKSNSRL